MRNQSYKTLKNLKRQRIQGKFYSLAVELEKKKAYTILCSDIVNHRHTNSWRRTRVIKAKTEFSCVAYSIFSSKGAYERLL